MAEVEERPEVQYVQYYHGRLGEIARPAVGREGAQIKGEISGESRTA